MIAAPGSGSGKTMVTCGLLTLLKRKGYNPAAFKCGPDYIDGLFHRRVLGVENENLDSFFETGTHMRQKLSRRTVWGACPFGGVPLRLEIFLDFRLFWWWMEEEPAYR